MAIVAAEKALVCLRSGKPIDTDILSILCESIGEPVDFFERRPHSAFISCPVSRKQTESAIRWLEDFIDDRAMETK